ncbi:hypothetical protein H9P43_001662 [Blastocladiella emersonii ATCC 22665]|nr:hypothetical protein H9P43_001662 [Blastocladiella emersonii ATCC 22665]
MLRFTSRAAAVRRPALRLLSSEVAAAPKATATATVSSKDYAYYKRKEVVMTGPRFEQIDLEAQPKPTPAMDLIAQEPVRKVNKRIVACDGGGGPLGHPKVYINLDQPGNHSCGYCGIRFEQEHHHHH